LARILLALKTILGDSRQVENYVFDEVIWAFSRSIC